MKLIRTHGAAKAAGTTHTIKLFNHVPTTLDVRKFNITEEGSGTYRGWYLDDMEDITPVVGMKFTVGQLVLNRDATHAGEWQEVIAVYSPDGSVISGASSSVSSTSASTGAIHMNGKVYEGVVVKTRKVAAGEGVSCAAVDKSEIIYSEPAFIALSDDNAKAHILANAIKAKPGLDPNDPVAPVEVKVRSFA